MSSGKQFSVAEGVFCDVDNGVAVYLAKPKNTKSGGSSAKGLAVFGKLLPNGQEFQISQSTADEGPSIIGNKVVWVKEGKIYCAEIDLNLKVTQGK